MFLSSYPSHTWKGYFKIIMEAGEKEREEWVKGERKRGRKKNNALQERNNCLGERWVRETEMRMLIGITRNWKEEVQRIKVTFLRREEKESGEVNLFIYWASIMCYMLSTAAGLYYKVKECTISDLKRLIISCKYSNQEWTWNILLTVRCIILHSTGLLHYAEKKRKDLWMTRFFVKGKTTEDA